MATTFPTTAYTNGVTATADMINKSITAGYTPNTALAQNDVVAALLANFLTVLPAIKIYSVTFDPASVAANITAEQSMTVTGIATTDVILSISPPAALNAGLFIGGYRIASADTVTIRLGNCTAGALDAASGTWIVVATAKAT